MSRILPTLPIRPFRAWDSPILCLPGNAIGFMLVPSSENLSNLACCTETFTILDNLVTNRSSRSWP